ncbi:EscI/YscI/HrpB family type III secretion system inner rod protein [Pantoea stewartii]|uniref:EscI/YscI/HrpB family type III secretion system inner rod protein n=1 Tax=Pantoea stewartii TaxID=66269 RepID=UPI001980E4DD|nr:EscI/YscI/HrpB family type III secretion system inner rod protein [Pantoea stewartii]
MKVTSIQNTNVAPDLTINATFSEPQKSDVDYFSSQLAADFSESETKKIKPISHSSEIFSELSQTFTSNEHKRDLAFKDLKNASRSSDMLAMSRANESISNYYIESLMNAKIVSKATQTLDKLTNLQ